MAKILIGLSILFLTLSAVLGVLNNNRARGLRDQQEQTAAALAEAEQVRLAQEREIANREKAIEEARAVAKEVENRVANAEADLIRTQTEKTELQSRIEANETEIADLRRRLEEASAAAAQEILPDALPMPGAGDLAQQLEDTRRQLDAAERERALLADRVRSVEERGQPQQRRRAAAAPAVRGSVMAVNHAYNFVVLNLGARQGLEPNTEMLVIRGGTTIGRIRISSVEPATAIGDIVTASLARGVQVQPGDTVIYAGAP